MRVVQWHGWLLEGSGSNVYAARVTEVLRRQGHDVLLVCQERNVERYGFLDRWGSVSGAGVSGVVTTGAAPSSGRATLLRPEIGSVLPVFVVDEYEGFEVKRFVDLTDEELATYLDRNVAALRAAIEWHGADVVIAGHVVPGGVIARRAVGPGVAVVKVHGSDLEYAVRPDDRYRVLAREGLVDARAVVGASRDVLRRTFSFVREAEPLGRVVAPGIDERFQPMPRAEGLESAASALDDDPDASRGRPPGLDERVREALGQRDGWAIEDLGSIYDQEVPDPGAAAALRSLTGSRAPFVGYFGKLIPQKGPQLLLQAVARLGAGSSVQTIVVGFGSFREWLHALVAGLDAGDVDAVRWIASTTGIDLELTGEEIEAAAGLAGGVTFTGRLDHRYAPGTLAAVDVLVVPSVLDEAFGIVAIEGAAAGAVPVVARHSGLAEVAAALEAGVRADGTPRFSYEPGAGAVARIAAAIDGHLGLPVEDRARLREEVASFAAREWSWDHTARLLLEAGAPRSG